MALSNQSGTNRVALYARVSTVGHGQDVGLQLEELRAIADQRGWKTAGEYVDDGVSGAKESRPALDRLLDDARRGCFSVLVVWKLDRLGRSLRHLLGLLDELRTAGVEFVSLRDPGMDSTSPHGRLMIQVIGAFCEFERSLIQERVRAGVARAKANGTHCGRPRNELDLRAAHALLGQGHSERQTAEMLGIPRGTLRRRLREHKEGGSEVASNDAA